MKATTGLRTHNLCTGVLLAFTAFVSINFQICFADAKVAGARVPTSEERSPAVADPWDKRTSSVVPLSDDLLYDVPPVSSSDRFRVLRDRDSRISQEFRVPTGIEDLVNFWLGVYTEYTTRHVVIFDSHDPRLVYDVLDFRTLAKTSRNAAAYEIVSKRRVKAKMAAFRNALIRLAKNPKPKNPSEEERKILALMATTRSTENFASLARHVRSQTGQRDNVIRGLVGAEPFLSKMELIFREMNVPVELTRLPLVESSFNLRALSRVGAAGVWQFMPASAKEFMTLTPVIDERLSPLKATIAAAKLLKRNERILGSWALAVISYNHGLRNLPRYGNKPHTFADIAHLFAPTRGKKSRLGFASKNYYAEFLAMVHAEAYRDIYFPKVPRQATHTLVFEKTSVPMSALTIASNKGIAPGSFSMLNPDIRNLSAPLPPGFWYAYPAKEDHLAILAIKNDRPRVVFKTASRNGVRKANLKVAQKKPRIERTKAYSAKPAPRPVRARGNPRDQI